MGENVLKLRALDSLLAVATAGGPHLQKFVRAD